MILPPQITEPPPSSRRFLTFANGCWLAAYFATVAGIVAGLFHLQDWAIQTYDTPAASAEWQQWREAARQQSRGAGPVSRRVPLSTAPPTLTLLTEYFGTCLFGAVLFGSLLFAAVMILGRGTFATPTKIFTDN